MGAPPALWARNVNLIKKTMNSEAVFEQLKKNRKLSLNWQAGWLAGWLDEWIARKQKLSRRRDYSAKSGLVA